MIGKEIIDEFQEHISEKIRPIIKAILKVSESTNDKITKKYEKDIRLMETICYKCKNRTMKRMGKTHKKKEYIIKRMNHKTAKKKLETKGIVKSLNKTDFYNKLKLWIVKLNILKEKFKNKKELVKYSFIKRKKDISHLRL